MTQKRFFRVVDLLDQVPGLMRDHLTWWERQGYITPEKVKKGFVVRRRYSEEQVEKIKLIWKYYKDGCKPAVACQKALEDLERGDSKKTTFEQFPMQVDKVSVAEPNQSLEQEQFRRFQELFQKLLETSESILESVSPLRSELVNLRSELLDVVRRTSEGLVRRIDRLERRSHGSGVDRLEEKIENLQESIGAAGISALPKRGFLAQKTAQDYSGERFKRKEEEKQGIPAGMAVPYMKPLLN